MATLHLAILQHQYYDWNQIYTAPTNKEKDGIPINNEKYRTELNNAVDKYTTAANKIRDQCMDGCFGKIELTDWEKDGMHNIVRGQDKKRWVKDDFRDPPINILFTTTAGEASQWTGELRSQKLHQIMRTQDDITYRQQIDDLLSPFLLWPTFKNKPGIAIDSVRRERSWTSNIMGWGISVNMTCFNDKEFAQQHGPVTRVELHGYSDLHGMEVWYGGASSGLRGCKRRGDVATSMDVDASKNEAIVQVSGKGSQWIESLRFYVSQDKKIELGGHGDGGIPKDPDTFHMGMKELGPSKDGQGMATLHYLSGWSKQGKDTIEQIGVTFHRFVDLDRIETA